MANTNPGVRVNDLTDHLLLGELSGASAMSGMPVTVEAAQPIPTPSWERPEHEFLRSAARKCYWINRHSYSAIWGAAVVDQAAGRMPQPDPTCTE